MPYMDPMGYRFFRHAKLVYIGLWTNPHFRYRVGVAVFVLNLVGFGL